MSDKVYFVSGHRDITDEEFQKHYEPVLFKVINEEAKFIVADCRGCDIMAQKYLKAMMVPKDNVRVYHMFDEPRFNAGFHTIGGFANDIGRDTAMTEDSDVDIAWVRFGKERSGTAQNIDRRKMMR